MEDEDKKKGGEKNIVYFSPINRGRDREETYYGIPDDVSDFDFENYWDIDTYYNINNYYYSPNPNIPQWKAIKR